MRKTLNKISDKQHKEVLNALYDTAENLSSSPQSVKTFIDDVLTEGEKIIIGRRILIAKLTLAGLSQPEISERLQGVSPNTFGRIYKWLDGQFPGYETALKQTKKEEKVRADKRRKLRREYVQPFSFEDLRRRYPLHFLLFNVADKLFKK